VNLFAAESDLITLLSQFEAKVDVSYVRAGMFDGEIVVRFSSSAEIPELGVASSSDQNQCATFLIVPGDSEIRVRSIQQRRGGTRYAIDQLMNPSTLAFVAGGVFGESYVIAGQFGTCTDDPISLDLMRGLTNLVRGQFERIKSYFVGPKAKALMEQGYRLTPDARLSEEYDLVVS
jgi:hypothetical protein